MRIGIDIDDTIVNTWDECIPYFSKLFNKTVEELKKSRPYYRAVSDKCSLEEYYDILGNTYEKATRNVKLKDNAARVINKLHDMGYKIIFITARGKGYEDSYEYTKDFLDRNGIGYDKIVVGAINKAKVCEKENIDIMIDDAIHNCEDVLNTGIDVIMFGTEYNSEVKHIKRINDWEKIYDYIVSR